VNGKKTEENMKKLLAQKYLSLTVILLFSFVLAAYVANTIKEVLVQYAPTIGEEVEHFLPITIENGKIVYPENKVMSRCYMNDEYCVVLDTTTDEIKAEDLKQGVYISRKNIYMVTPQKTEIKPLTLENTVIDNEVWQSMLETLVAKLPIITFVVLCLFLNIYVSGFILLCSGIIYFCKSWFSKSDFGQIFKVSTLALVLVEIISVVFGFALSAFSVLCLLFFANIAVDSLLKKDAEK
jgi:hypothetical protein